MTHKTTISYEYDVPPGTPWPPVVDHELTEFYPIHGKTIGDIYLVCNQSKEYKSDFHQAWIVEKDWESFCKAVEFTSVLIPNASKIVYLGYKAHFLFYGRRNAFLHDGMVVYIDSFSGLKLLT